MRKPELQVNLFEVPLTDKSFTLHSRALKPAERLGPQEREWRTGDASGRRAVLVVSQEDRQAYSSQNVAARDIPHFLVERLLENGLIAALRTAGKDVEQQLTSFVAFDPSDTVDTGESFLQLRKGVDFASDYVSIDGRAQFGFFASLKVRLRFTVDLSDSKLADAALQQPVFVTQDSAQRRMQLVSFDNSSATAEVFDEDANATNTVDFASVQVPTSRPILQAYCKSLGKPQLASQLIGLSQEASFRLNKNGTRNRAWLRNELDFVRAWLARASSGGRLIFHIPNTSQDVFLSATAATARFTEL